jgi:hypothetical protein
MAARDINPRELIARALKVSAMVTLVPACETKALNHACAALLESWPQADRDELARAAGVRSPSEKTWELLCDVVRRRPVPTMDDLDAHTRALPLLRVLKGGRS